MVSVARINAIGLSFDIQLQYIVRMNGCISRKKDQELVFLSKQAFIRRGNTLVKLHDDLTFVILLLEYKILYLICIRMSLH